MSFIFIFQTLYFHMHIDIYQYALLHMHMNSYLHYSLSDHRTDSLSMAVTMSCQTKVLFHILTPVWNFLASGPKLRLCPKDITTNFYEQVILSSKFLKCFKFSRLVNFLEFSFLTCIHNLKTSHVQ